MKFKINSYKKSILLFTVFVIIAMNVIPLINTNITKYSPSVVEDNTPEIAQIETVALKPDGDVENQWNDGVPTPHSIYLVDDPDNPDQDYVIESGDSDLYERYNFETADIGSSEITQIRVRIRAAYLGLGTPQVNLYFDGAYQGWKNLISDLNNAHDYIWTGLNGYQTDLDGLQVRFNSSLSGMVRTNIIWALEAYASYDPSISSGVVRPSDDGTTQWLPAVGYHWIRLDEDVIDPDAGDSSFIVAASYDNGDIDEFFMDNNVQFVREVTEIQVKTYGYFVGTHRPRVSIYWNGTWQSWKTVYLPGSLYPYPAPGIGWATNTWTLEGNQKDVDNLRVRYKANVQNVPYALNLINAFYCKILYEAVDISNFTEGFLYAQSSVSHIISPVGPESVESWIDDYAAITSVENPGDYLVIYTASYKVSPVSVFEGYGWVKLVTDEGVIGKTKRFHDCLNPEVDSGGYIWGSMIVADVLTLGSGGVKAEISFWAEWNEDLYIYDRSISAIPLENGYEYISSTNPRSWAYQDDTYQDDDIHLEDLTGEYFAIYTASFQVTDDVNIDPFGVHSNGWAFFAGSNSGDYSYTRRDWEFPASFAKIMRGTILIADKISLNNEDLLIKLELDQRDDEKITIMERSLILIPLVNNFTYESEDDQIFYPDLNQDIVFENINYHFFVMYTSNIVFTDLEGEPVYDQVIGNGWAAFNNGSDTIDYTTRHHNFKAGLTGGYGAGLTHTKYLIEIMDLHGQDLRVEYFFDPNDDEEFSLGQRSMIVIPFLP